MDAPQVGLQADKHASVWSDMTNAAPDVGAAIVVAVIYAAFFIIKQDRKTAPSGDVVATAIGTALISGVCRVLWHLLHGSYSSRLALDEQIYIGLGCITLAYVSFVEIYKRFRTAAAKHPPGWEPHTGD